MEAYYSGSRQLLCLSTAKEVVVCWVISINFGYLYRKYLVVWWEDENFRFVRWRVAIMHACNPCLIPNSATSSALHYIIIYIFVNISFRTNQRILICSIQKVGDGKKADSINVCFLLSCLSRSCAASRAHKSGLWNMLGFILSNEERSSIYMELWVAATSTPQLEWTLKMVVDMSFRPVEFCNSDVPYHFRHAREVSRLLISTAVDRVNIWIFFMFYFTLFFHKEFH